MWLCAVDDWLRVRMWLCAVMKCFVLVMDPKLIEWLCAVYDMASCECDMAICGFDKASCGDDMASCGYDLASCLIRIHK